MNSIPAHFCAKFYILQGVAQSEKGSFRLSHTFATENAYGGTRALPRNRAQSALFGLNQASPSQILAPDFEACNIIYFLISLLKKLNNFTEVRYVKSIFILTLFQSHIIHHLKSISRIAKGCTMCKVHCSVAGFVVYIYISRLFSVQLHSSVFNFRPCCLDVADSIYLKEKDIMRFYIVYKNT